MRGRRPKPTGLKILDGNAGHRPINDQEPDPAPAEALPAPKWLGKKAKEEWGRLMPELTRLGLLSALDLGSFECLCQAYGQWRDYEGLCKKHGLQAAVQLGFRKSADDGHKLYLRAAVEFGFTPSSRSRVRVKRAPPIAEPSKVKQRFFGAS